VQSRVSAGNVHKYLPKTNIGKVSDSFSHGSHGRETGRTLPVVLSSTGTALAVRAGTSSTAYGFFSYTRVWRPTGMSWLSAFPNSFP
jgi:hypothetical protein